MALASREDLARASRLELMVAAESTPTSTRMTITGPTLLASQRRRRPRSFSRFPCPRVNSRSLLSVLVSMA